MKPEEAGAETRPPPLSLSCEKNAVPGGRSVYVKGGGEGGWAGGGERGGGKVRGRGEGEGEGRRKS